MSDQAEKPQLHMSALNMLNRCGIQFQFRYIDKIIAPPAVAVIVGSATDASVTKNLTAKKDTGQLLSLGEVQQEAADTLEVSWNSGVMLDPDEVKLGNATVKGQAIDKAIRLSTLHATDLAPVIEPSHVQWPWVVHLPGFPMDLAGTIDIREEGEKRIVRDTKTKSKSPRAEEANMSDQLTAYALAVKVIDGAIPDYVVLDHLVDNKKPIIKTLVSTRDNDDFNVLLRRVENAAKVMESGAFTPMDQTNPMCSPRYCGYYSMCAFAKKPKVFQLGGIE